MPDRDIRRRSGTCGALLLAGLALTACSYQPTIRHPVLDDDVKAEAYDCRQLDVAILKADTVRWVIRDDGGKLLTSQERAVRVAGNTALLVATTIATWDLLLVPAAGGFSDGSGHAALDAADRHILELLHLKQERACSATATGDPGLTDLEMMAMLDPLMEPAARPERATLDRRTALLDTLRPPAGNLPDPAD
jgi:hypothetical protein